jgi:hypothetical protein
MTRRNHITDALDASPLASPCRLLSLVAVALFIVASYQPASENEPPWAVAIELLLTIYFLFDYALRWVQSCVQLATANG